MTDLHSLLKLLSWLSPTFPTGAFSYSHGLEAAVHDGLVVDRQSLENWLATLLERGSGWNDAVILAASWKACDSQKTLEEIAMLAVAISGSKTRHLETTAQCNAFVTAAKNWNLRLCNQLPAPCALPVAIGALAGAEQIPLETTLTSFLHAFVSNQIQAALRLMKLGQSNAVLLLKQLEPNILTTSKRAAASTLDDLGGNSFLAEIAAMRHEVLGTRIFRT